MPRQRKRPARVGRPQVYMSEYITTSFGYIPKRDIRDALIGAAIFMATLYASARFFWWVFWG